jgi:transposase
VNERLKRARYTAEFKAEAVRQVRAGKSIGVVAMALGMPKASLSNWVRDAVRGSTGSAARSSQGGAPAAVTPEQAEIARLRAENARLKMERDIAKKAAAYFAQDLLQGTPGFGR